VVLCETLALPVKLRSAQELAKTRGAGGPGVPKTLRTCAVCKKNKLNRRGLAGLDGMQLVRGKLDPLACNSL
jgi:hypothetical protein